ncbi:hypothetical protein [Glycomyces niveus]|uniref:Uncharacterized protein n=1 Tax=Glycomyces niveus TaxID=2820287 RepID=A0ABS3U2X9_9ACTN|nr:hypothetical protein [Glycomyces sp. NEAU-S30]MBO3733124.1 hypothetical protein [Glycomyces sp. NEAU-S30]
MSDYNDIVDANGEIIHVSADDSADGVRMTQDGEQLVLVDEDAIAAFTTRAATTLTDLDTARSVLTVGDMNAVAGLPFIGDSVFVQIDAKNLKIGTFPEAHALAEAYFQNFYLSSADQVERIYHGIGTGKTVADETMTAYLDSDGNVSADMSALAGEFTTAGGGLTEADLAEMNTHEVAEGDGTGGETSTDGGAGNDEDVRIM